MSSSQSKKQFRLPSIFEKALDLFEGDAASARKWLETPNKAFGNQTPLDYSQSEWGAREVKNLLGRLDHGVFS